MRFRREARTRHEAKQRHGIIIVCIRRVSRNQLPALAGHSIPILIHPLCPSAIQQLEIIICRFRDSCNKSGQRTTIYESKQTEKGAPYYSGTE